MDDMINMAMFTSEAAPTHVMIGCGEVDLDRVSLNKIGEMLSLVGVCLVIEINSNKIS